LFLAGGLGFCLAAQAEPPAEVPQISVLKQFDADDLNFTGFLASRDADEFPDYRVYLGVDHGADFGSLAQLTSRAFYGTGTYDGFDPNGPALPEAVRTSGVGAGQWVGADWKVESHFIPRHALSARVEYRQELDLDPLDFNTLPDRKVGFVTNDNVSLADNLSLNVRLRYDEAATSGFEVGMERNGFRGTRTRMSYAWQAATDSLAGNSSSLSQHLARMSMEVPILPKRLSTSFELQYVGLTGPLIVDSDRQRVIGNFTLASSTVSRDTRVTFGMRNLFGAKPVSSAGPVTSFVPPDGRSLRLDVERKL
jgi:hypothetical protein